MILQESIVIHPLLDAGQIQLLRESLGAAELSEMYGELPRAARSAAAEIERATRVLADLDQVRKAAHVLKGIASSFGTPRLSFVAEAIELRTSSIDEADRALIVLGEVLHETVLALSNLGLDQRADGFAD